MSDLLREDIIQKVHDNEWPDELLFSDYDYFRYYILAPVERICLEDKVRGFSNEEICKCQGITKGTLERRIRSIKQKMRVGGRVRVDNFFQLRHGEGVSKLQYRKFMRQIGDKRSFHKERYFL